MCTFIVYYQIISYTLSISSKKENLIVSQLWIDAKVLTQLIIK